MRNCNMEKGTNVMRYIDVLPVIFDDYEIAGGPKRPTTAGLTFTGPQW